MFEEIRKAALEYEKKYQRKPEVLCVNQHALEALYLEELTHSVITNPERSTLKVFGMDVISTNDDCFGFQIYEHSELNEAALRYERNLYPTSSVRVYRPRPMQIIKQPTNPYAKPIAPDTGVDPIDIPQQVIGAYKRLMKN